MDMMAMVSSMLAMQASSTQMQVAASFIKQNADAEKSAVMTLLGAARIRRPSQLDVPPKILRVVPGARAAISYAIPGNKIRQRALSVSSQP